MDCRKNPKQNLELLLNFLILSIIKDIILYPIIKNNDIICQPLSLANEVICCGSGAYFIIKNETNIRTICITKLITNCIKNPLQKFFIVILLSI